MEKKFRFWDGVQFSYFTLGQTWTDWMFSVYHDHCLNGRKPHQYTGRKDKNGVEIYEGDVVKHRYVWETYHPDSEDTTDNESITEKEVVFIGGAWHLKGDPVKLFGLDQKELEVIGNIYETPDLAINIKDVQTTK